LIGGRRVLHRVITAVILILLLLLGGGYLYYRSVSFDRNNKFNGILYDKKAANFTLVNQNGEKTALSEFRGKIVLIDFGYTQCPDICPVILSKLSDVMHELGNQDENVQVMFITVDPERDTVERLRDYMPYFDTNFLGLTGSPEDIDKVAKSYHIFYDKEYKDTKDDYLMSHTSSLYLIDQRGHLLLIYPNDRLDPKLIVQDIKKLL
jgi:protein SCO1/2